MIMLSKEQILRCHGHGLGGGVHVKNVRKVRNMQYLAVDGQFFSLNLMNKPHQTRLSVEFEMRSNFVQGVPKVIIQMFGLIARPVII